MPEPASTPANGGFKPEKLHRRQFQKLTADIVDSHAGAIFELRDKLKANSEFMADMSTRIDQHSTEIVAEECARRVDVAELRGRQTAFQNRSFGDRLRWLFTGQ